jgi:hypothetical protein
MKKDESKLYFPYFPVQILFIQFLVTQKDPKRSLLKIIISVKCSTSNFFSHCEEKNASTVTYAFKNVFCSQEKNVHTLNEHQSKWLDLYLRTGNASVRTTHESGDQVLSSFHLYFKKEIASHAVFFLYWNAA